MRRRGMRALARLLRLSALGTLAVTLWLLASTPVAQYYTANSAAQRSAERWAARPTVPGWTLRSRARWPRSRATGC